MVAWVFGLLSRSGHFKYLFTHYGTYGVGIRESLWCNGWPASAAVAGRNSTMGMIDVHTLAFGPGLFLSCRVLANANDIGECLTDSEHEFVRVGYTGVWLANRHTIDYLAAELPQLKQALVRAEAPGSGD